jgi:hypothetical protein
VIGERKNELRQMMMLFSGHHARLGRLVKAVVVRLVEAPKPIHDLAV